MSAASPDLIDGYLAELCAGLRVPAGEAELILAEAEDHLRETAAAALAVGLTELEAQRAAISSFGPVRAVTRAHRRRIVTAGDAAMAAWKLAGLLATTIGAGGVVGLGVVAYSLRSIPAGLLTPGTAEPAGPASLTVPAGLMGWVDAGRLTAPGPGLQALVIYAVMAAGGLTLLAMRRLARRGTPGREPLSPGATAMCFLLAAALVWISGSLPRLAPAVPPQPGLPCSFSCNAGGPGRAVGLGPGPDLVHVLLLCAAMTAGGLILAATRWLTRRGPLGREPLFPGATATCFLLAAMLLIALNASVVMVLLDPLRVSWLAPMSQGSVSAAPPVLHAILAGCLAMAVGYGAQAALRRVGLGLNQVRSAASWARLIAAA